MLLQFCFLMVLLLLFYATAIFCCSLLHTAAVYVAVVDDLLLYGIGVYCCHW